VIFEDRGAPERVEEYVGDYVAEFPPAYYSTSLTDHPAPKGMKCIRVVRRKLFD
jgi:hypothetical protein